MVRVSGVPYEVNLPTDPVRKEFEQWWFEMEGFSMRCERPKTHTDAAWIAWQYRQQQIDELKSKVKVLAEECNWLNSIDKRSTEVIQNGKKGLD